MLLSMTGFGRTEKIIGDKKFSIEIKSLNGKQFELQLRIPLILRPYEIKIRKLIADKLIRGSVDCIIVLKSSGKLQPITINTDLGKAYFDSINKFAGECNLDTSQVLSTILKMPDVINPSDETVSEEEWVQLEEALNTALDALNKHRSAEGKSLEIDICKRIENIITHQKTIESLLPERLKRVKENLNNAIDANLDKNKFDENRMHQELIYYLEKLDINEETVRLKNHCDYFSKLIEEKIESKGKKISFLLQELGREINTIGSKANDANIQTNVVMMKDELEKAKEQMMNIL